MAQQVQDLKSENTELINKINSRDTLLRRRAKDKNEIANEVDVSNLVKEHSNEVKLMQAQIDSLKSLTTGLMD